MKNFCLILASTFLLVVILNSLFFQTTWEFPTLNFILLSFCIILFALVSFFQMIRAPVKTVIEKQYLFWFNTANLFFFSLTFLFFAYYQYLHDINEFIPKWGFYTLWGANLVLYSSYFYSIYLQVSQDQ